MNLKELKDNFTTMTGMPAKKVYVVLAAPSFTNRKLQSKKDWELVLKSVKFKLVAIEREKSKDHNSSENIIDEDWLKQLDEIDNKFKQEREKFKQNNDNKNYQCDEFIDFNLIENKFNFEFQHCNSTKEIKVLYRKLSKQHHPDNGGSSEIFTLINEAYKLALERTSKIE